MCSSSGSPKVHETATYRCDDTRGCVMQFGPPDDEHMCTKHVEASDKLIVKQTFCASSWLITEINILRCTVSKTSKNLIPCLQIYTPFFLLQPNISLNIMSVMKLIVHLLSQTVCRCCFKRKIELFILFRSMMLAPRLQSDTDTFWIDLKPWSFFRVPLGAWIRVHYFPALYFTVKDQSVIWTKFWSKNF